MNEERRDERRRPGRPPRPMPQRIDASPEAVARMLVTTPPKRRPFPPLPRGCPPAECLG